jgi:protein-S-isoprenylcysteine O-methyltransferase Ste14
MVELGIDLKRYEKPADSDVKIKKESSIKSNSSAPLILSVILIAGYFLILGSIFFVEVSDTLNMKSGENSLMGEFKILLGVLTAGVGQTLSYWLSKK